MFQRRHYKKIALWANRMNLTEEQFLILLQELNMFSNFNETMFVRYYKQLRERSKTRTIQKINKYKLLTHLNLINSYVR
jgi:hypothetical protein